MSDQQNNEDTIMTYAELIEQWYGRSVSEKDIFTRFMFLYISFIAYLAQVWPEKNDREMINNLKNATKAKAYYTSLIVHNSELRDTLQELYEELEIQPIRNDTRPNDRNWRGQQDGVLGGIADWKNLVEFWYRVRNNLFHGHKAPDFDRDKRLISYAYLTLTPFMKHFIDQDLIWDFN